MNFIAQPKYDANVFYPWHGIDYVLKRHEYHFYVDKILAYVSAH